MNSRERELLVKQEGDPNYNKYTPSVRSRWSSHKNPRIVRVSRSFGGKDRHSKVCTVRGLRDRRIRLSVPTAIQLYDLQDKLGLSQPSKVVDWLLDATKNDVDKLPPLPVTPETFTQFHESSQLPNPQVQSSLSQFLASNQNFGTNPSKEVLKMNDQRGERGKWIEQENNEGFGGFVAQLSAQNLFPLGNVNQSCFPTMPYNPYFHWDHPNLCLSHLGGAFPFPNQAEDQSQNNNLYLPSIVPSFPSYLSPSMENVQQNPLFSTALQLSSTTKSFASNVNSRSAHIQPNDQGKRSDSVL